MKRSAWLALAVGFASTPVLLIIYGSLAAALLDRDLTAWARHDAAYEMARSLRDAVDLYRRDNQKVPDDEEGLPSLVPKYVRTIPLDPWGNAFVYRSQGGDWADVVSLGRDTMPGGSDLDSDVSARYGSPGTAPPRSMVDLLLLLVLALPLAAFAATFLRGTAVSALAGIALFWAWVAAATVAPDADLSVALAAAMAAIVVAVLGAILSLRGLRGGPTTALLGALGCLTAAALIMG